MIGQVIIRSTCYLGHLEKQFCLLFSLLRRRVTSQQHRTTPQMGITAVLFAMLGQAAITTK